MPWYDLPLEQLREYRTSTQEPEGLDDWWARRIEAARALARPPVLTPHQPRLYDPVEVYDVEFSGGGGDPIRAWYLRPRDTPAAPMSSSSSATAAAAARRPSTCCCPRSATRCS